MRHLMGLVVTGSLLLGLADESKAQFSLSIGNPYTSQGYGFGAPAYGYGSNYGSPYSYTAYGAPGYGGFSNNYYSSNVIGTPGFTSYSSGYSGYARYPNTGYQTLNHYYGAYGYGNYGYGSRDGFRPFRRFR